MTTAHGYVPTKCKGCGRHIVIVNATRSDGERIKVPLDVAAPVYVLQPDGEGGAVWAQDTSQDMLVAHTAVCKPQGGPL